MPETLATPNALDQQAWGETADGTPVNLYFLRNDHGVVAAITNYGGIITQLHLPDVNGETSDVVLGFEELGGFLGEHPYFGAIVGRYANRIADAAFELDGNHYELDANNGPNSLHGGFEGFDKRVWTVDGFQAFDGREARLNLSLVSPDGDQGFPGELTVRATYVLTADSRLRLEMDAESDAATICNLTQHAYFNLDGHDGATNLDHELKLESDAFLPVNENLIPLGESGEVAGTPFDFREFKRIGDEVEADDEQLRLGGGYDHNWLVRHADGQLRLAATARSPQSGRRMEVWTTAPGVQFYGGNFLDGTLQGKDGVAYQRRCAICLEPQVYPDTPNQPQFPSAVVRPGEPYRHVIEYRFGAST
jgi:aldose 1-epimerase